jgi:mRNA interferase RelE/StbE
LTPKRKRQVADKIQSLGDDPRPSDSKSVEDFDRYIRADSGEYRFIYRIDPDVELLATLSKRDAAAE